MQSNDWLERFADTLPASDSVILADIREFSDWWNASRAAQFAPNKNDDVAIRTYLLDLQARDVDRPALNRAMASLKRLYDWAQASGLIEKTPFAQFDFDRPILSREQIRRREETFVGDARERQVARLHALYQLGEQLNRAANLQAALEVTLETLVKVMGLKAAWAFLHTASGLAQFLSGNPPHDFALVASCQLPPGLEQNDRHYLCTSPDCHCQAYLRLGLLTRAVNVVECTRLIDSAKASGDNRGLLFHASVPLYLHGHARGIMNFATEEWQFLTSADLELLSAAGALVSAALERASLYDQLQAQSVRLERELEMAREVQASLLPARLPTIPGFSLAAEWRSARQVGGDFYDVFALPDDRWGLVIADVSDKGAPAALYMAMTRSLLRSYAMQTLSPAYALAQVNRAILSHSTSDMFITVFYGILNPRDRTLMYANAGHNPPLLRSANGAMDELSRTGILLAAFDGLEFTEKKIQLARGDLLVAYTDGVTEALNARGEMFGDARLARLVAMAPSPASAVLERINRDLSEFSNEMDQSDDITLLVLQCE